MHDEEKPTSTATPRRRRPVGVTLLELLIVLAVLLALMAIALPFTLRSLEARELESTEESIASELIKARVKAQESGRPVEVVVEDTPPRVIVRYFRQDELGNTLYGDRDEFGGESDARAKSSANVDPVRDSWWEESALHPSVSLTGADAEVASDGHDATAKESAAKDRNPVRLAVYMPDGTTLFAATLLLMHQNGLKSRISVDPWTGQPAIKRGASGAAQAPPDDELSPADGFDDLDEKSSEPNGERPEFDDALEGFDREAGR